MPRVNLKHAYIICLMILYKYYAYYVNPFIHSVAQEQNRTSGTCRKGWSKCIYGGIFMAIIVAVLAVLIIPILGK